MTLYQSLFNTRRVAPLETEAAVQVDWTGGINLCSNETKLLPNEVKSACNVDFLPDGGVCRRNALQPFSSDLPSPPCSEPICYEDSSGAVHLIFELENGQIMDLANGPITGPFFGTSVGAPVLNNLGWSIPGDCKLTGCEVCGNLYVTKGDGWYRWDGGSLVPVPEGFREDEFEDTELPDFSAFCQTGIPAGKHCLVWDSRFWVAGTTIRRAVMTDIMEEQTVADTLAEGEELPPGADPDFVCGEICVGQERARDANGCVIYEEVYDCAGIYFSFAFGAGDREGPEDFFSEWNYRLKTTGNDCIVKMLAAGPNMYVFQQNTITRFTPFFGEPSTIPYQLFTYSTDVGAVGEKACCVDGNGVWFFDREQGLMRINGEGQLEGHFDKIKCILTDGTLHYDLSGAAVTCCNGRVWVSLREAGEDHNSITYVYDPAIGAWTIYKQGFVCFKDYQPTGFRPDSCDEQLQRPSFCLGVVVSPCPNVVILDREVECEDNRVDNFGYIQQPIESSVTTGWFDGGVSEAVKDWCGIEAIVQGDLGQSLEVTGFTDWNPCDFAGRYTVDASHPKAGVKPPFIDGKLDLGPVLIECNVNDEEGTARPRQPFMSEAQKGVTVGVEDKLPLPVRIGKMCPGRSLCLSFTPKGDGKWNLCRLTMFFKRKPVRC